MKKLMLTLFFVACTIVCPLETQNAPRSKNYIEWIIEYQKTFKNLELAEVMTIIKRESHFNQKCKTWEANVRDYSYGPMQVRGSTAKSIGYTGPLEKLLSWETGLYWGMKYLSYCKDRATRSVLEESIALTDEECLSNAAPDLHAIRKRMFSLYNAGNLYYRTDTVDGVEQKNYINHQYVLYCEQKYWFYYRYNKWHKT